MTPRQLLQTCALSSLLFLAGCPVPEGEPDPTVVRLREQIRNEFPDALQLRTPEPSSLTRVALGEALFFDPNLSSCGTVACASCHVPELGFSDGRRVSEGCGGATGRRNSNTLYGVAYSDHLFWDGRAGSLEEQALDPVVDPVEMANSWDSVIHYLSTGEHSGTGRRFPGSARFYSEHFSQEFSGEVSPGNAAKALAAYQSTIVSTDSPFDRWLTGDNSALSPAQKKGALVFFGRGQCSQCHPPPHFTDFDFHNVGIPRTGLERPEFFPHNREIAGIPDAVDPGRAEVARFRSSPEELGRFKTPTLRNVALTAPYMHNGRFAGLDGVLQHYWNVGRGTGTPLIGTLDDHARHIMLTDFGGHPEDFANLIAFLNALTGTQVGGPPGGISPPGTRTDTD